MENHSAFATGKLLGVREKAVHDAQWQKLTEKLNCLDGPSKPIDGWKKVYFTKIYFTCIFLLILLNFYILRLFKIFPHY